jgi:hypothetical protein
VRFLDLTRISEDVTGHRLLARPPVMVVLVRYPPRYPGVRLRRRDRGLRVGGPVRGWVGWGIGVVGGDVAIGVFGRDRWGGGVDLVA